jgi:hypothetical protein
MEDLRILQDGSIGTTEYVSVWGSTKWKANFRALTALQDILVLRFTEHSVPAK